MSETSHDPTSTSNELVIWKYDNPYANYKLDPERIFLLNGYTLRINQKLNNIVDITQNTGNLVWDGAYILSKYIVNNLKNDATFRENIKYAAPFNEIRFLELGSGCGLAGLSTWILGGFVVCKRFNSESNLKNKNKLDVGLRGEDINVFPLNWEELPQDSSNPLHISNMLPFDIILASEIIYLFHLHKSLIKTIKYFSHLPCDTLEGRKENRRTLVLGIYKDRGLGESTFFDIANKFGKMKVIWIDNNWMIKEFNNYSQEYKMFWLIPFE
ncbi:7474_t:CDS:2 [Funneliformis caledonium]|uniref:7474_t:CDS:1 n=1 Tax=Funneliformis caledonium TaxID=1117310 RepID=A0A9N9AVJ8_9GLOM|nr:7474_t:CDS:2 [Funneliformis caledonium]